MPTSPATPLRRLYPEDMPGVWRKRLEVPIGQRAVAWRAGQPTVLESGRHRLGRPFPQVILLFPNDTFALHPSVPDLRSRDDEEWVADFVLTLRAPRPERLADLAEAAQPPAMVLQQRAQLEAYPHLWRLVNNRSAAELAEPQVAGEMAASLRQVLASLLEPSGLRVEGVPALSLRPAAPAPAAAEEPPAQEGGLPLLAVPAEEQSAVSRAAGLVETAIRRLGHRAEEEPAKAGTSWIVQTLRVLGYMLIGSAALFNILWPGSEEQLSVRVISSLASLILAVAAIFSSEWVNRHLRLRARRERIQAPFRPSWRQELNRLATVQMAGALEQACRHLEEAWGRAFKSGRHELATAVRQVARAMASAQEEIARTAEASAGLLTRPAPPLEILEAWVYLDQRLLAQLQELAGRSQQLFEQATEGRWAEVEAESRQVERALEQARGEIVRRRALLEAV